MVRRRIPWIVLVLAGCASRARPVRGPLHPERPPELLVTFHDHIERDFALVQVSFVLDGQPIYMRACTDDPDCHRDLHDHMIYFARTSPGAHQLRMHLLYRGNASPYGVFSYIRAYRFEVRSSHRATAGWGWRTRVDATAFEDGGPTTPIEQRPAVRWADHVDDA
jgi:hypothetical protein